MPDPLTISIALPSSWLTEDDRREAVRARVEVELRDLLNELNATLPTVQVQTHSGRSGRQVIGVTIEGRPCPYPPTALGEAIAYTSGEPIQSAEFDAGTLKRAVESLIVQDSDRLEEVTALVCREAVSSNLNLLNRNEPVRPGPDESEPSITLLAEARYFEELVATADTPAVFAFFRDGLWIELGVTVPRMHLDLESTMQPRGFAFEMNGLRTLPRIGLDQDTILVNATPELLAGRDVFARPAANPATGQPNAVTSSQHRERLEQAGWTTWDPFGYFILALAEATRRHGHRLLNETVTRRMLGDLAKAFPAVTDAAATFRVEADLPRVLRDLLEDRVSIRNLVLILDVLIRRQSGDDGPWGDDLTNEVRKELAHQIGSQVSRGTNTIVVYLIEETLERAFERADESADFSQIDALSERLRHAVNRELTHLPSTASPPAILTQSIVRRAIASSLRSEFPRITVLSYEELPAHYMVQPVARISATD